MSPHSALFFCLISLSVDDFGHVLYINLISRDIIIIGNVAIPEIFPHFRQTMDHHALSRQVTGRENSAASPSLSAFLHSECYISLWASVFRPRGFPPDAVFPGSGHDMQVRQGLRRVPSGRRRFSSDADYRGGAGVSRKNSTLSVLCPGLFFQA